MKIVNKPVKASDVYFSLGRAKALRKKLQDAFDILDGCDNETFEALNGESIMDDLDLHIRQLDSLINRK